MTPPLVSIPRLTTLLTSLLVALSSGTNYVYSAYSPQLGARLGMTHTQLNVIALAGNLGVYVSGPIWGKIVDRRGPRILLASAFTFLLTGYLGMRYFYASGLPGGVAHISLPSFILLAFCSFLTGAGGNAGLSSAINSTAKTFPDKARASTTGLVISGFGLSAFFFSTVAHLFPGDTSSFLLLLALGTSTPMIIGFFFVRPIPLPQEEKFEGDEEGGEEGILTTLLHHHQPDHTNEFHPLNHDTIEASTEPLTGREVETLPNLYGKRLFKSLDFWLLSIILSILSGTGLMYINNVGSMSQTLYAHEIPAAQYNPSTAASWQATQVSTISLTNFLGRIFIGLISDYSKHSYGLPRSYCLTLVSIMFFLSQLVTISVASISTLWIASLLLGLAYGSVFSLFPTVCLEWFGMPHFSENWGYMGISPIFAGNLFALLFGTNLDRHSSPPSPSSVARSLLSDTLSLSPPSAKLDRPYLARYISIAQILPRAGPPSPTPGELDRPLCLTGRQCYVSTIYITTLATFSVILLSMYAGYRDRHRETNRAGPRSGVTSSVMVPRKTPRCSDSEEGEGPSSSWDRRDEIYE